MHINIRDIFSVLFLGGLRIKFDEDQKAISIRNNSFSQRSKTGFRCLV